MNYICVRLLETTHSLFGKKVMSQMIKQRKRYIYWQDENLWLGYLEDYPDYWTQAETQQELQANLIDLYNEVKHETAKSDRKVAELEIYN
jgi:predicted RNase H-like HicB family nuclease